MFLNKASYNLAALMVALALFTTQIVALPNDVGELQRRSLKASNYISHSMDRQKPIHAVAPSPGLFGKYDDAALLAAGHGGKSTLIIAYNRWALFSIGDNVVYAFATPDYSATLNDKAINGQPLDGPTLNQKRDHPFSWGFGSSGDPLPCTPGGPCDDDDDCAVYNCNVCNYGNGPDEIGWCWA